MNIEQQEAQLFGQWSEGRANFVSDGVVSETDYISSALKICFVLKEVNDPDGGGWDLRKYLREGARSQSWDNVTRWVRCIRNPAGDIPWSDLKNGSQDLRISTLKSICTMNLKKSPGGKEIERLSFNQAIEEDKGFIKSQYAIYAPDITVCCGTGYEFRYAIGLDDCEILETSRGIEWFRNDQGKPVVMYAHPGARVSSALLTYGFSDAIKEILRSN